MAQATSIEFSVNGTELFKQASNIRAVKAEKMLIATRKGSLHFGFQEPEAIAWLKYDTKNDVKFKPFAVDSFNFLKLCQHRANLKFQGDISLNAIANEGTFTAKNIPIEPFQPDLEYLKFKSGDISGIYQEFLTALRPSLKLALALDTSVKSVQITRHDNTLFIISMTPAGSLGLITVWKFGKTWGKFFDEQKFKTWLLPATAVNAFLNNEANILQVKDTKITVYGSKFHIIFTQLGEPKPIATFTNLLEKPAKVLLEIEYKAALEIINQLPNAKTLELKLQGSKTLLLEATGYGRIQTQMRIKKITGEDDTIVLNFGQFKRLLSTVQEFTGIVSWGDFIKISCENGNFTHNWLLAKSYNTDGDI